MEVAYKLRLHYTLFCSNLKSYSLFPKVKIPPGVWVAYTTYESHLHCHIHDVSTSREKLLTTSCHLMQRVSKFKEHTSHMEMLL
jgi:hypothetical protein